MELTKWLMLNFTLPKEPSRTRVSAWRKLKKSGSVTIGQSTWVLPLSDEYITIFNEISGDILQNGGEAYILKAEFISTGKAEDITGFFNTARDEEYKEFLGKCEDFVREIEKLDVWLKKIMARDFFDAPLKNTSIEALKKCKDIFADFCEKVYERNN